MDTESNISPPAGSTVMMVQLRLPAPPPPEVVILLDPADWRQLDRLTKLTGHDAGEAAAILLDECLFAKAAAPLFHQAAQSLRALYAQRRNALPTVPAPAAESTGVPPAATEIKPNPKRIRIPLSTRLNQRLYLLATESGLRRETLARELLVVAIHKIQGFALELEAKATELKGPGTPAGAAGGVVPPTSLPS